MENETNEIKENEKTELLKLDEPREKNKNNVLIYIVIAIISLVIGAIPAFIIGKSYSEKKEPLVNNNSNEEKEEIKDCETPNTEKEENDNEEPSVEKQEEEKENIPVGDSFTFNGFINGGSFYIIDSKKDVYYASSAYQFNGAQRIVTLDYCVDNPTDDYCDEMNPGYTQNFVKVENLSNVKKLKMYDNPHANDESFSTFAITYDGTVYILSNTTAKEFSLFKDLKVKDFTMDEYQASYSVTLLDGTTKKVSKPHSFDMPA